MFADLDATALLLTGAIGAAFALSQATLAFLIAKFTPPLWSQQAAFVAHQLIALPLMLYVAALGSVAWFSPREAGTVEDRIFGHDPTGSRLAIVLLGALVLWDIPMTFHPSIYSAASMGHHVGLAVLAVLSLYPFMQYYTPFFVGVVELSSVPLQVVDFFRPEHFGRLLEGRPALGMLNTVARGTFTLSFIVVRTVWFPIVVFASVLPDLVSITRSSTQGSGHVALAVAGICFSVAFTALQWFWSWLLLKQVMKMLRGAARGDPQDGPQPAADSDTAKLTPLLSSDGRAVSH